MHISKEGIKLIKQFEGCRLKAYKDVAGIPTIGYGHTHLVKMSDQITQDQADAYLREDVKLAEAQVDKYMKVYGFNQNEFDALVSFAFNIGSIRQLTANGTRSKGQIASKMLLYNKAGGTVLNGLIKRRKAEHALFIKPCVPFIVGNTYLVCVSALNVRKAPNVEAPKALKTPYGRGKKIKCLDVIKDCDGNTWIKIESQKNYYYICGIYKGKVYVK